MLKLLVKIFSLSRPTRRSGIPSSERKSPFLLDDRNYRCLKNLNHYHKFLSQVLTKEDQTFLHTINWNPTIIFGL